MNVLPNKCRNRQLIRTRTMMSEKRRENIWRRSATSKLRLSKLAAKYRLTSFERPFLLLGLLSCVPCAVFKEKASLMQVRLWVARDRYSVRLEREDR